jgi:hypothetical protein
MTSKRCFILPASLDEIVLRSFRVDTEALRNLDSIARQRASEIYDSLSIEYDVLRADSLKYTTSDIEELIRERNGTETQILSVKLRIGKEKDNRFNFEVTFTQHVKISGESDDRASLILLASDVRSLIREQMRSRRSIGLRTRIIAAVSVGAIACITFMAYGSQYLNSFYAKTNTQYNHLEQADDRNIASAVKSMQQTLSKYQAQAHSNSIASEQKFMSEAEVAQLRYDITNGLSISNPAGLTPNSPWWADSLPAFLGVWIVISAITWSVSYLIYPPAGAVFLIGDEIRRQAKQTKLRERLVWGIGATFVLGIASALVATMILR